MAMTKGMVAGFGWPMPTTDLRDLKAMLGTGGLVRTALDIDAPLDRQEAVADNLVGTGLTPLFLLGFERPRVVQPGEKPAPWTREELIAHTQRAFNIWTARGLEPWVEPANEPHIFGQWTKNPVGWGDTLLLAHEVLRTAGFKGPILGAVADANPDWAWYANQMKWSRLPTDIVAVLHRYPRDLDVAKPLGTFKDRDAEWAYIQKQVGAGRSIAVTEFGHHNSREKVNRQKHTFLWFTWYSGGTWKQRTEQECADAIRWELDFFERKGAVAAVYYQFNDGDKPPMFGARKDAIDRPWKAQGHALASWRQEVPEPVPGGKELHAANFLSMPGYAFGLRHPYWDAQTRAGHIAALKASGLRDLHLLAIENDAASQIDLYADPAYARTVLSEITSAGLRPWLWFLPETPSVVNQHSVGAWISKFLALMAQVDDLVEGYCMGLETTEYWTEADLAAAVAAVRAHTTKPIAVHGIQSYVYGPEVYASGATYHFHQYQHDDVPGGFVTSEDVIASETASGARAMAGRGVRFVGFEYALGQPDAATDPLGLAALELGSFGYGNGGPREPEQHYEAPVEVGLWQDEIPAHEVAWTHHDVSAWPITSRLMAVSVEAVGGERRINFPHTKAGLWPVAAPFAEWAVEGNVWIFWELDGRWHGATWEWLKPGSVSRSILIEQGFGASIKIGPMVGREPAPGQECAIMVSTCARTGPVGPVQERSQIVRFTWPG